MFNLTGSRVSDPNFVLRFLLLCFFGLMAIGSVIYWRSSFLQSYEYRDFSPISITKSAGNDSVEPANSDEADDQTPSKSNKTR